MWSSLYLCLLLLSSVLAYDYLIHTALQKVPAKVGQDVQLRCIKIIEELQGDILESPTSCSPLWGKESCYHSWSRDGMLLNGGNGKYEMKSIITFDYCENFEWTTDLIKSYGPIVDVNQVKPGYYPSSDMSCYSSALTIRNVQESDFGEYRCNFSDHQNFEANKYSEFSKYDNVRNITLYNIADTNIQQPVSVVYFQNYFTKGLKNKLLIQCVVSGGQLNWYFRVPNDGCTKWPEKDVQSESCAMFTFDKLNSTDFWRCFSVSEQSHSPYKGITESFIYVSSICTLDFAAVSCGVGDVSPSDKAYIQERIEWYDGYYYYNNDKEFAIFITCTTILPVVALFMIIALIVACVRSKMCCNSHVTPLLHYQQNIGTLSPQPQYNPYTTAVTPVQQVNIPPPQHQTFPA